MTKIKIKSNPYTREISYLSFDDSLNQWVDVKESDENSRLREIDAERAFLPFYIKEIIDIILDAYYVGREKIEIYFEGSQDEYNQVKAICLQEEYQDKVSLSQEPTFLANARYIKPHIKEIFKKVEPIIKDIMADDTQVKSDLEKVSKALNDVIPICVFGNYSSGKSTFINSLIGYEILPSGGDPVTAKIYEIKRSENDDRAEVRFKYHGKDFTISFVNEKYNVELGEKECPVVIGMDEAIQATKQKDLISMLRVSLEYINDYEKIDKDEIEIGNVIEIDVPFSRKGVLGDSLNRFVIFDTPGSNSNSNADHSKVLSEAMAGFSNGIPVWVTDYEHIDTEDNASLCDRVLGIEALDKRFTMIVLNRADNSDLPEGGFSEEHEREIKEYKAVDKMYASGIYFVSSIMGLGGKKDGELVDKYYRKIYRTQVEMYKNPEDEDYAELYKFNIMPAQIKQRTIMESGGCNNTVYANSGLFCIESEIEKFANDYSAYNKCQMVRSFINSVIEKTTYKINTKAEILKKAKEKSMQELDSKKIQLKDTINDSAKKMESDYEVASKNDVAKYASESLKYTFDAEALSSMDLEKRKMSFSVNNFEENVQEYEESQNKLRQHFKEGAQGLLHKNIFENVKGVVEDLSKDLKDVKETKNKMKDREKELDRAVSDEIVDYVKNVYKVNVDDAQEKLDLHLGNFWREKELDFKNALIREVSSSDALTESQRDEIAEVIRNYKTIDFKDDAETVFAKEKFLQGFLFGFKIGDSEKLNTNRLANRYNEQMEKIVISMSSEMNNNCFARFKTWEKVLLNKIEANLTEYNPELKSLAEIIRIESESIAELEDYQNTIQSSLGAINKLMSWKEA